MSNIKDAITQEDIILTWWRHQMETFSALLALCAGKSPVSVELPFTKAIDAQLWCFLWSLSEIGIKKYNNFNARKSSLNIVYKTATISFVTQWAPWRLKSRPDCLLNRLFKGRSKKTSNFRVTGVCEGNPPCVGIHQCVGFPPTKDQ